MLIVDQPRDPTMHILRFQQTVGCQIAAALAVSAAVWREHSVSMFEKHLSETYLACAGICDPMQDQNGVTIRLLWIEKPRA
jgi:hypothetical protein